MRSGRLARQDRAAGRRTDAVVLARSHRRGMRSSLGSPISTRAVIRPPTSAALVTLPSVASMRRRYRRCATNHDDRGPHRSTAPRKGKAIWPPSPERSSTIATNRLALVRAPCTMASSFAIRASGTFGFAIADLALMIRVSLTALCDCLYGKQLFRVGWMVAPSSAARPLAS